MKLFIKSIALLLIALIISNSERYTSGGGSRKVEVIRYQDPTRFMDETVGVVANNVNAGTQGIPDSLFKIIMDENRFYNFNSNPNKELLLEMSQLQIDLLFTKRQYREAVISSNNYEISNEARVSLFANNCESNYGFKPKVSPVLHGLSEEYGSVIMYKGSPVLVVGNGNQKVTPTFYKYSERLCRFNHLGGVTLGYQIPQIDVFYYPENSSNPITLTKVQQDWVNILSFSKYTQQVAVDGLLISYYASTDNGIIEIIPSGDGGKSRKAASF